ncbi:MAG: FprA family A-type flavoprotein, partial [Candidatus Omnitrophica bacterium]|nr:FprA family A-type flavoprotein [Candidatus Omnitrophota bacterium]
FGSKGFVFGSSTHDNNMLPAMAGFLDFFKGLKPKNRIGAAFGSHGWSGGAVKDIEEIFKGAGVELALPGISVQYVPDKNEAKQCYEFGQEFAAKINEKK